MILLQALALYPILYLNVAAALANIDPAMEEAAANLGSNGWSTFRRITLPLMMPGLFAGGALVFIAGELLSALWLREPALAESSLTSHGSSTSTPPSSS